MKRLLRIARMLRDLETVSQRVPAARTTHPIALGRP
jgi:hypothetical protein